MPSERDRGRASRPPRAPTASLALGGGSAIDLGKAVSAETGLPLVSVPTTYAGAEWTPYFGVRDRGRRIQRRRRRARTSRASSTSRS